MKNIISFYIGRKFRDVFSKQNLNTFLSENSLYLIVFNVLSWKYCLNFVLVLMKKAYFLIPCAQSKITLFIFCIIESGQETKDSQFVVSAVMLSRVTSRVVMSNLQVFI